MKTLKFSTVYDSGRNQFSHRVTSEVQEDMMCTQSTVCSVNYRTLKRIHKAFATCALHLSLQHILSLDPDIKDCFTSRYHITSQSVNHHWSIHITAGQQDGSPTNHRHRQEWHQTTRPQGSICLISGRNRSQWVTKLSWDLKLNQLRDGIEKRILGTFHGVHQLWLLTWASALGTEGLSAWSPGTSWCQRHQTPFW